MFTIYMVLTAIWQKNQGLFQDSPGVKISFSRAFSIMYLWSYANQDCAMHWVHFTLIWGDWRLVLANLPGFLGHFMKSKDFQEQNMFILQFQDFSGLLRLIWTLEKDLHGHVGVLSLCITGIKSIWLVLKEQQVKFCHNLMLWMNTNHVWIPALNYYVMKKHENTPF